MERTSSDTQLYVRRSPGRVSTAGPVPVPGYTGHIPSHRHEARRCSSGSCESRARSGIDEWRGYGTVARGIPGYGGHIPGKAAENVFADTWLKSNTRSLGSHLVARNDAPKEWSLLTEGRTLLPAAAADAIVEVPLKNPSYQDCARGWSACGFTGARIEAAGRIAPKDRQEAFGCSAPRPPRDMPIHGYTGWVRGRAGESVVGERQSMTRTISDHLSKKNSIRVTQR
mmetsp:Transcript_84299/g.188201  ORF Transcript_84299/g.188201 Transcript_84299/m.188201 type:complete len:227 (-) Transcript_84299:135-815(-)